MSPEEAAECFVEYDRLRFTDEEFAKRAENMKKGVSIREDCPVDPSAEGVLCRAGSTSFIDVGRKNASVRNVSRILRLTCSAKALIRRGIRFGGRLRRYDCPQNACHVRKKEMCSVCAAVCMSEKGSFDAVPEYVCRMTDEIYRLTVADIHENTDWER